jgi:uncharacterized protein
MKMHEVRFAGRPPVDGYGAGGFRIGGYAHQGGLLLLPGRIGQWAPADPLTLDCFADVVAAAADIDVLLIGTGARLTSPPPGLRPVLEAQGFGVDFMATPAACRTYNVLLAEERRVAAVLSPV